jgi:hypothetical protein
MNSAALADESVLIFAFEQTPASRRSLKAFRPLSRPSSFLLLAQKKRTKEKGLPRQSNPKSENFTGFPDSPSWLGRETAHIRVRRPSGLDRAAAIHRKKRILTNATILQCKLSGQKAQRKRQKNITHSFA